MLQLLNYPGLPLKQILYLLVDLIIKAILGVIGIQHYAFGSHFLPPSLGLPLRPIHGGGVSMSEIEYALLGVGRFLLGGQSLVEHQLFANCGNLRGIRKLQRGDVSDRHVPLPLLFYLTQVLLLWDFT